MLKQKINFAIAVFAAFFLLPVFLSCNGGGGGGTGNDSTKVITKAPGTYIRHNCATPEGQADMEALAKALAIMKKYPCDTTYSWYYQAGIHSVPNVVANGNPLCPSYVQMAQMKEAWMNCTHDPQGFSEQHFLIWHRLYIWYFEQIVRKLSGKADFALPYWDYTDTAHRVMPAIFRDKNDSLYESARLPSLNSGDPIARFMNNNLNMRTKNQNKLYFTFDPDIDAAPHGAMHNYIGGGYANDSTMWNRIYQGPNYGLMAQVESAAFDPIFWVHHANIDYLWAKWDSGMASKRPNIDTLLTYPWAYKFFNADGKKEEYTIPQALDKAFNLDYKYDVLPVKALTLTTEKKVPERRQEILSVDLQAPVKTDKQLINIPVAPTANENISLLQKTDMSRKASIIKVTVGFAKQPKGDYDLYIDTENAKDEKLVGTLTFFGAMHMQEPAAEYHKTFLFDISDELDIKQIKGQLKLLVVRRGGGPNEISIRHVTVETRDF